MSLFRVKALWTGFGGAPGYSVFHFDAPDEAAGPSALDCVTAVDNFFSSLADRLPSVVKVQVQGAVERIDQATGDLLGFEDVTQPGARTGTVTGGFSSATGACVTWTTNGVRNGRRVRGRTFLVPLAGACYDTDGTLTSIALSDIQASAQLLVDDFAGMAVFARPTTATSADGSVHSITGMRVSDKTAVLRSRRD